MAHIDFALLTQYAKAFTGVTPEYELLLSDLGHHVIPRLDKVTDEDHMSEGVVSPKSRDLWE